MLILFWVIVGLVGILLYRNARMIIRDYILDRNQVKIFVYFVPLLALTYLFINITGRTLDFVEQTEELNSSNVIPVRTWIPAHQWKKHHARPAAQVVEIPSDI